MYDFEAYGGGGGGGSLAYAGEGTYGTAGYRPPYTYTSQNEYDAAVSGGYLGYTSMAMFAADSAARGEGGGGGGYETTSSGPDTVYVTGNSSAIGDKYYNQPYELFDGDDIAGQANMPSSGLMGDDFIKGNEGSDTIYAGAGSDWIKGGNGQDTLHGGFGDDVIVGGSGSDIIFSGPGTDILVGGDASDSEL